MKHKYGDVEYINLEDCWDDLRSLDIIGPISSIETLQYNRNDRYNLYVVVSSDSATITVRAMDGYKNGKELAYTRTFREVGKLIGKYKDIVLNDYLFGITE